MLPLMNFYIKIFARINPFNIKIYEFKNYLIASWSICKSCLLTLLSEMFDDSTVWFNMLTAVTFHVYILLYITLYQLFMPIEHHIVLNYHIQSVNNVSYLMLQVFYCRKYDTMCAEIVMFIHSVTLTAIFWCHEIWNWWLAIHLACTPVKCILSWSCVLLWLLQLLKVLPHHFQDDTISAVILGFTMCSSPRKKKFLKWNMLLNTYN